MAVVLSTWLAVSYPSARPVVVLPVAPPAHRRLEKSPPSSAAAPSSSVERTAASALHNTGGAGPWAARDRPPSLSGGPPTGPAPRRKSVEVQSAVARRRARCSPSSMGLKFSVVECEMVVGGVPKVPEAASVEAGPLARLRAPRWYLRRCMYVDDGRLDA